MGIQPLNYPPSSSSTFTSSPLQWAHFTQSRNTLKTTAGAARIYTNQRSVLPRSPSQQEPKDHPRGTWGACRVPAQSPQRLHRAHARLPRATLSPENRRARGLYKLSSGHEGCSALEEKVETSDSSHHTSSEYTTEGKESSRISSENERREKSPNLSKSFCSLPSKLKRVWMNNFHKMEQTHTHIHTNSRSIFQEIRNQENHQVRCLQ